MKYQLIFPYNLYSYLFNDNFKIIKDLEAVFWIKDRSNVLTIIEEALKNPTKTLKGREQWIQRVTTLPIEETNKRMWNNLINSDEV